MARSFRRGARRRKRQSLKRKRSRRTSKRFRSRVLSVVHAAADHKWAGVAAENNTTLNSASPSTVFTAIAQGTTDSTRLGDTIAMRSLKMNFHFYGNTAAGQPQTIRLIIGCWNDYQQTSPTTAKLLQTLTIVSITPYLRDPLAARQWIPMYDATFTVGTVAGTKEKDKVLKLTFAGKRLPKKNMKFNAAGTPSHVYFWLAISDAVANSCGYHFHNRYTWTDI